MVQPRRRLIRAAASTVAAVLLLGLAALGTLWWMLESGWLTSRIEAAASTQLGREVHLGTLHWEPGWRIGIESRDGWVGNEPGAVPGRQASWERLALGVALRPLLRRQVQVDRVEAGGLAVALPAEEEGTPWRLQGARLSLRPELDEAGRPRLLHDVELDGQLFGAVLPATGLALAVQVGQVVVGEDVLPLSLLQLRARMGGGQFESPRMEVALDGATRGPVTLRVPSLREQLASFGIEFAQMRDPAVPGRLELSAQMEHDPGRGSLQLDGLDATLDGVHLQGNLALLSMAPPRLRFALQADAVEMDRYLAPEGVEGDPFELPVELLRALDAQGTLHVDKAMFAGFTARDVVLTAQ